jgi:hypothetical protein
MSVQGATAQPFQPLASTAAPKRAAHAHHAHHPHAASATAAASSTDPAQAPNDASLWNLLTDDERSFFSQQNSLGALTYGRGAAAAAAPAAGPIGQRLDVRG